LDAEAKSKRRYKDFFLFNSIGYSPVRYAAPRRISRKNPRAKPLSRKEKNVKFLS
jgi:hypothetical protein